MRVLILGGTKFLGRHLVEAAHAGGHDVTLFHRGQTGADLFPDVERILGDRDGELGRLRGREFDAVIDTCGYVPRLVGDAARALADATGHYTFVSSISVYKDFPVGLDELAPVIELEDPSVEEVTPETYGGLKALCERAAEEAMPGRVLQVRSGLIVGPHDPTDRFTYWVRRVSRGGDVLVPTPPGRGLQFIHARDLANWILRMAETRTPGIINATGPDTLVTMETFLETCRKVGGGNARWIWVDEDWLNEREVGFWSELPMCMPGALAGVLRTDVSRALASGLTFRPMATTIRETLAWDAVRPQGTELTAGLNASREAELLAAAREAGVRTGSW